MFLLGSYLGIKILKLKYDSVGNKKRVWIKILK